jgi:23S rRNA (uracil1939-C5)-methyltransferase
VKPAREDTITIEALARSGEGLARVGGRTVLVPGTLPGERVRVRLPVASGTAALLAVESASPLRRVPPCAIVEQCGGCTWQHVPAELQRESRLEHLRRALPPHARGMAVECVPAPEAYGYRTRARLAWSTRRGRIELGFRARASHEVVDVARCVVLAPALEAALGPLREALASLGPRGEVGIALGDGARPVANLRPEAMPDAAGYAVPEALVARGFVGAALWPPGASAATVAGDPRPVVRGGDGRPLWLAPEGFAQANEALNANLAARVAADARPAGAVVLELYAGAGNFTVLLAREAKRVVAVEADRPASTALAANLAARGLENVTVVTEDAARVAAERRADVVVLDPPRTGARETCEALARRPPARLVYVSCDPPTLGRDLATLDPSMELVSLAAFEMFPQTPHLEVVAALRRRRAARA